jgi:hypothetical protein
LVAGWDIIFKYFALGYPTAVGLATTYVFWYGFPGERKRLVLYLFIVALVGPLTFINFTHSDQLVDVRLQALFDLFTAFVALCLILNVRALKPSSKDGVALQSLTVLVLTAFGVVLPLFYSGVFALVFFGWIDHHQAQSIGDRTALGLSGVVGTLVAFLNGLEALRAQKAKEVPKHVPIRKPRD